MVRSNVVRAALLGGGLVCAGCSEELKACDIRDDTCQEDVFLAVQSVREAGWDPWLELPPTRVITIQEYRRELDAEEQSYEETPEEQAWLRALQLVRLISPDPTSDELVTDDRGERIAAYYYNRKITVIDHGTPTDPETDVHTLAHELVHAAQDREVGLAWYQGQSRSLDELIARTAILEGDATLYSNLILVTMNDAAPRRVDWDRYHREFTDAMRGVTWESASPYYDVHGLVYPLGSQRLTDVWLSGGSAATRTLYADGPLTTQELMAGEQPSSGPAELRCALPEPNGFELVGAAPSLFGALMLYAFATRVTNDDSAWFLGKTWRADRFAIFISPSQDLFVSWAIQLSSATDAERLSSLVVAAALPGVQAKSFGDEVSIVATDPPELVMALPPSCP